MTIGAGYCAVSIDLRELSDSRPMQVLLLFPFLEVDPSSWRQWALKQLVRMSTPVAAAAAGYAPTSTANTADDAAGNAVATNASPTTAPLLLPSQTPPLPASTRKQFQFQNMVVFK